VPLWLRTSHRSGTQHDTIDVTGRELGQTRSSATSRSGRAAIGNAKPETLSEVEHALALILGIDAPTTRAT
jgi:hypothetical protein